MRRYYVMGFCHIDLAWLADAEEYECYLEQLTVVMLDMLEQFPDIVYVIEQAYHYRELEKRRPDLVARLSKRIAEGRIEVMGGMASTMETNIPAAECFVRNQLIGMRWFRQHMSAEVRTGWLIDTFGINAQVPQVLASFGVKHLMANRFGGEKCRDVFFAEGLDGMKVLVAGRDVMAQSLPSPERTRVFHSYAVHGETLDAMFEDALACQLEGPILVNACLENEWMPNRRLVRNARALAERVAAAGRGSAAFELPRAFFAALDRSGISFPTDSADLNPEFTGTYSQRVQIKLRNRRAEAAVLDAETWRALSGGRRSEAMEQAWWDLAFIHFHDVFTGSHPDCVFRDVMGRLDRMEKAAWVESSAALGGGRPVSGVEQWIDVYNALPFARNDWVAIDWLEGMGATVLDGNVELPCRIEGGKLGFMATVKPCAASRYLVKPTSAALLPGGDSSVDRAELSSEHLSLVVDARDGVTLKSLRDGRILLKNALDLLVLQEDVGGFQMEEICAAERYAWGSDVRVAQHGNGDISASGSFTAPNGSLQAGWSVRFSLVEDGAALALDAKIDWQASANRLRLKLSTELRDVGQGICEVPFGVVKRPAYSPAYNKKGEWPVQRFATVQDKEWGMALINTGVPGVEILSGTIYTTLLRAPTGKYAGMVPDSTSSQHGEHEFSFVLYPYQGDWEDSKLLQMAQRINRPLRAYVAGAGPVVRDSALSVDQPNVLLHAVKQPEDIDKPGIVLRLAETCGRETDCVVRVAGAVRATSMTMAEVDIMALSIDGGEIRLHFAPHQIQTIWVER